MLPFFRLGIGGPVAGGRQYMPWIHVDDLVACTSRRSTARTGPAPSTPTAPDPPTNKEFSRALGRALHRPAFAPVPAFAIRLLYGEMADIVSPASARCPDRALALGFTYTHPDLDEALRELRVKLPPRGLSHVVYLYAGRNWHRRPKPG